MIQTQGLTRRFGESVAVDDLTLEVPAGEVFGFLGPNGAGKTTTLRLLLGLLAPDAGSARIDGLDVSRHGRAVRSRCGALLDTPGLYETLSVMENLRLHGGLQGLDAREVRRRAEALLDQFGLADRANEPAGRLSLGMRQKLGIARALLHRPKLLFLDEPTRGLDPAATVDLRHRLLALAREGGTTLFITSHDLDEIERICKRVGLLIGGRLRRIGSVDAIRRAAGAESITLQAPAFPPTFIAALDEQCVRSSGDRLTLTCPVGTDLTPLIRAALAHGVSLQEVRRDVLSLETAYLRLVEATS